MRVLVTGSNGMVGHAVKEVITDHDLILTDISELDVRDYPRVMKYFELKPQIILHLAAETDLEFCESHPEAAYLTNTIGTANMVMLAKKLGISIVYMSTAGVFDGSKIKPYNINDRPNPVNHYGRSKYYGEMVVRSYYFHYIIRASWMMGGGRGVDKKFVNKIIKKIEAGEKHIKVCNDVIGSPTYTIDLVKNIQRIMNRKMKHGLYHCAGTGGHPSRAEVAKEIVKLLAPKVYIEEVSSQDVSKDFPCARSHNEVLTNSGWIEMRDWKKSLKDYIDAHYRY